MKKLLLVLAVAGFVACNNGGGEDTSVDTTTSTTTTIDTNTTVSPDTTVRIDTTTIKVDTTK
jgi:hypothetical protein